MIEKYGYKIGRYLLKKGYLDSEEDADYIRYAIVALSSDILNTLGILCVALFSHKLIEMVIYLIGFHLLRSNAGGYHAPSFIRCVILTILDFLIAVWYSTLSMTWMTVCFLLIAVVIFFRNLPWFTEDQWQYAHIKEKHVRCKIISILLLTASIIFYSLGYVSYFHIIGILMMEVALSMNYGRYRHEGNEKHCKETGDSWKTE